MMLKKSLHDPELASLVQSGVVGRWTAHIDQKDLWFMMSPINPNKLVIRRVPIFASLDRAPKMEWLHSLINGDWSYK